MQLADLRGSGVLPYARKSLRAFKRTPHYRSLLEGLLAHRETVSMTSLERRRLRLERLLAGMELERLQRGERLSEFSGVLALHDPLDGRHEGVDE